MLAQRRLSQTGIWIKMNGQGGKLRRTCYSLMFRNIVLLIEEEGIYIFHF